MNKKIFYFTDNVNMTQSVGNSFGPEPTDSQNKFNVTSIQNADENQTVNAVSVCSGYLLAVNNTEFSDCVNLVLMPDEQPDAELPYVKYYIYRGVKKDSLFENNILKSASNNDLLASIWETQAVINSEFDKSNDNPIGTTNTPPSSNALEYAITSNTDLNTPIYNLFSAFNNGEYQPPAVKGGWSLGKFKSDNIGFEIVIEQIGYDLVLNDLCLNKNQILAPSIDTNSSDLDRFNHWLEKEKILSYLSPCAFFGSFYSSKLYLKGNNAPFTGNGLITNFLKGHFIDANTVYVDIKNEHEYSYDFSRYYKGFNSSNQQASILINTNTDVNDLSDYQLVDYSNYSNYNWPLLTLSNNDFSMQAGNEKLKFDLSFPKVDLLNRILVVKQGELEIKRKKRSKKQAGNYTFPVFETNSISCKPISFNFRNISSSSVDIAPSYLRLCYAKEAPQCPANLNQSNGNLEFKNVYDLDNVFTPFSMVIPWNVNDAEPESPLSWLYHNEQYIDVMRTSGCSFIGKSGIAKDTNGDVTLFSFSVRKVLGVNKTQETPFSLTGRVDKVGNTSFLKSLSKKYSLGQTKLFIKLTETVEGEDVSILKEVSFFGNLSFAERNIFDNLSASDFAFFKLSNEDYQEIIQKINESNFIPDTRVHLGFNLIKTQEMELYPEDYSFEGTSEEQAAAFSKLKYKKISKFEILISGYSNIQDQVTVNTISTGVFHYRIQNEMNFDLLLSLGNNSFRKHYEISDVINNFTVPNDPLNQFITHVSQNPQPVTKFSIRCNIYLYRDDGLSPEEFCAYKTYVHENIQKVWNSSSNLGLGAVYNPDQSNPTNGSIYREYWIDATQVKILEASNSQLSKLEKNEVLFIVAPNVNSDSISPEEQSFVFDNRKTGVLRCRENSIINGIYDPSGYIPNIPAHEFGHVLGLVDYYSYLGKVYDGSDQCIANPYGVSHYLSKFTNAVTFIPVSEDSEYPVRYNWLHNLMASLRHVGHVFDNTIEAIKGESTYGFFMKPYLDSNTSHHDQFITLFVTKKQIETIFNYNKQQNKHIDLYFKEMSGTDHDDIENLKGSIVGRNNGNLVSDTDFEHGTNQFNVLAHSMEGRVNTSSLGGWFNPIWGANPIIKGNEPRIDSNSYNELKKLYKTEITLMDLITNGNSFNKGTNGWKVDRPDSINDYGLKLLICDFQMIYGNFKLIRDYTQDLSEIDNYAKSLITKEYKKVISCYANKRLFTAQEFDNTLYHNFGSGDIFGKSIWNNHVSSNAINTTAPSNQPQLNIPGEYNYSFLIFSHTAGSIAGSKRRAWEKLGLGTDPNFSVKFNVFINRKQIIDLFK